MNRWCFRGFLVTTSACLSVMGNPALGEQNSCVLNDPVVGRKDPVACAPEENSQKLPDALVLPMPCGQSMVFRKIVVSGENFLDHQKLSIGGGLSGEVTSEVMRVTQAPREAFLAGSFAHGEGERETEGASELKEVGDKSYYIGKYEVLDHQYKLFDLGLMQADADPAACAEYKSEISTLTAKDVRPIGGVSWFDSVAFARAYSSWLLKLDKQGIKDGKAPSLPWEYGSTSYVRLPTEAEWEFAARGGLARGQDQTTKTYNIKDPDSGDIRLAAMSEVAVIAGSGERLKKLRPAGTRLPNVLGLYDTIGGVGEIVLDPFTATRPDIPHGQVGGYIVKGGHAKTPERLIGVGHRQEIPFFDNSGETRSSRHGFRVVISTPVFVAGKSKKKPWRRAVANPDLDAALSSAHDALVASVNEDNGELERSLADLREKLRSGNVENSQLVRQIGEAQQKLEASNAKINQRTAEVRYERFRSLIFTARSINLQGASNFTISRRIKKRRDEIAAKSDLTEDGKKRLFLTLDEAEKKLKRRELAINANFGLYVDLLQQAWRSETAQIEGDSRRLRSELERSGANEFVRYVDVIREHLETLSGADGVLTTDQREAILRDVDQFRTKRNIAFSAE